MLLLSKDAEIDLAYSYEWYAHKNAALGTEFIHEVDLILTKIEQNPGIYQEVVTGIHRHYVKNFPLPSTSKSAHQISW